LIKIYAKEKSRQLKNFQNRNTSLTNIKRIFKIPISKQLKGYPVLPV